VILMRDKSLEKYLTAVTTGLPKRRQAAIRSSLVRYAYEYFCELGASPTARKAMQAIEARTMLGKWYRANLLHAARLVSNDIDPFNDSEEKRWDGDEFLRAITAFETLKRGNRKLHLSRGHFWHTKAASFTDTSADDLKVLYCRLYPKLLSGEIASMDRPARVALLNDECMKMPLPDVLKAKTSRKRKTPEPKPLLQDTNNSDSDSDDTDSSEPVPKKKSATKPKPPSPSSSGSSSSDDEPTQPLAQPAEETVSAESSSEEEEEEVAKPPTLTAAQTDDTSSVEEDSDSDDGEPAPVKATEQPEESSDDDDDDDESSGSEEEVVEAPPRPTGKKRRT